MPPPTTRTSVTPLRVRASQASSSGLTTGTNEMSTSSDHALYSSGPVPSVALGPTRQPASTRLSESTVRYRPDLNSALPMPSSLAENFEPPSTVSRSERGL